MPLYAQDVYTVNITPSSRPRAKQTMKFAKHWPTKTSLLHVIDINITNCERAVRVAEREQVNDEGYEQELEHWRLCRQIAELLPLSFTKPAIANIGVPIRVCVADTQVGVLNFETEEVYEYEA
jgi:hypothetical protein